MQRYAARLEAALRETAGWGLAATVDELASRACDAMLRLVPGDGAGWNEIDLRTGALRILASPVDYFPENDQRLAELLPENPLVEARARSGGRVLAFSDVVSVGEYHRRAIYAEVYRRFGVEDQLGGFVSARREAMVAVAINRSRRSFTAADRRLLELARSQLAAAYRTVLDRMQARARLAALERGLDAAETAVVFLARDGTPTDLTASARSLIHKWFADDVPAPGRYERDGAVLVVRRVEGDPPLLLLDERRLTPDPEQARGLGLTRRESEILALVADGLTNRAIADRLYLSPRTVQKHLEHAFARLGAHNRIEALRLLHGGAPPQR